MLLLAELAGEALKQGKVRLAASFGVPVIAGVCGFAWFRENVVRARIQDLIAASELPPSADIASAGLASLIIGIVGVLASSAIGYWTAPGSDEYDNRLKTLRAKKRRLGRLKGSRRYLETRVSRARAQREMLRNRAYWAAQMQVSRVDRLSKFYLQEYNLAAPREDRKSFPHPEHPVDIPEEIAPDGNKVPVS